MDNYIALIEALSGFTPDTVTIEVFPGFESITGGGDVNTLGGGQTVEGDQTNTAPLSQTVETQSNAALGGQNVAGDQYNTGLNSGNVGNEGDAYSGNASNNGDSAQVNNGEGDIVSDSAQVNNDEGDLVNGGQATGAAAQNVAGNQAVGLGAQNVDGNQAISGLGAATGGDVAGEGAVIGDDSNSGEQIVAEGDGDIDASSEQADGLFGTTGGGGGLANGWSQDNTWDFLNQDNDWNVTGLEILGGGLFGGVA